MSRRERDPVSGLETTGHEWNGIKELDAPVPRFFIGWYGLSVNAALLLVLLLPAIPLITSFTPGLIGYSERGIVEQQLREAVARQGDWQTRMADLTPAEIAADEDLAAIALAGGRAAFKINCVACHGEAGRGQRGYPNLTDDIWQWGSDLESIAETLRVGINSTHEETRVGQMPAFGDDGLLEAAQIDALVEQLRALAGLEHAAEPAARGAPVFEENCASCHGEAGEGNQDLGAPDLTDEDWLYGAAREDLFATIQHGRQGWMPHWSERLDPQTIKMLAIYVRALGEQP